MLVEMLETRRAAPDGIAVVELAAGKTFDLPDDLAARYLERGQAKPASGNAQAEELAQPAEGEGEEEKAQPAAPENKSEQAPADASAEKPKRASRARAARARTRKS